MERDCGGSRRTTGDARGERPCIEALGGFSDRSAVSGRPSESALADWQGTRRGDKGRGERTCLHCV